MPRKSDFGLEGIDGSSQPGEIVRDALAGAVEEPPGKAAHEQGSTSTSTLQTLERIIKTLNVSRASRGGTSHAKPGGFEPQIGRPRRLKSVLLNVRPVAEGVSHWCLKSRSLWPTVAWPVRLPPHTRCY
jgi:hypothetical protein